MNELLRDEISINSQTENLQIVRDFLFNVMERAKLPMGDRNKVILAVDEAVSNIIHHGYTKNDGEIIIEVEADIKKFSIIITDNGRFFDPTVSSHDIDLKTHIRSGKKRGLGLFLVQKIMDEVHYSFKDGQKNVLTLVKLF